VIKAIVKGRFGKEAIVALARGSRCRVVSRQSSPDRRLDYAYPLQAIDLALVRLLKRYFVAAPRWNTLQTFPTDRHEKRIGKKELEAGRGVAVAVLAMAISGLGAAFGIGILGFPIFSWLIWKRAVPAYQGLINEGRVRITVIDTLWCAGCYALGYYFWIALGCATYHLSELLLMRC